MRVLFSALLITLAVNLSAQSTDLLWKSGHRSTINQISISPDKKYFVSVEKDTTAILWEISSGQQVRTIKFVEAAKFRDNQSIYLAMTDKTFRLINLDGEVISHYSNKQQRYQLNTAYYDEIKRSLFPETGLYFFGGDLFDINRGYKHNINLSSHARSTVYSSDGKLIAGMTRKDPTLSIYNSLTGASIHKVSTALNIDQYPTLEFSANDQFILLYGSNKLQVVDVNSGSVIFTYSEKTDQNKIEKASFIPGTNNIAFATKDYDSWKLNVKAVDFKTKKIGWSVPLSTSDMIADVRPAPDGRSVIVWAKGDEVENIQAYNSVTGVSLWSKKHPEIRTALNHVFITFTDDSEQFLFGTNEDLQLWSAKDGKPFKDFSRKLPGTTSGLHYSDNGNQLAGESNGYLFSWNLRTGSMSGRVPNNYKNEKAQKVVMRTSPDRNRNFKLADNKLTEVDSTGKTIYEFKSSRVLENCSGLRVSHDGAYVMYYGSDPKGNCTDWKYLVQVFDTKTRLPVFTKACQPEKTQAFATHSNTLVIEDISKKNVLSFYDLATKKLLYDITVPDLYTGFSAPSFSSQDNYLSVASNKDGQKTTILVDLRTKTSFPVTVVPPELISTAAYGILSPIGFTADETYLLFHNSGNGNVGAFDIEARRFNRELTFRGPGTHTLFSSISVSPIGNTVFFSSYEQVIYVWDLLKKKLMATMYPSPKENNWAVVTPDGSFDANEGAQANMFHTTGSSVSPLSAMYEQFYKPRLLPRILEGESFEPPSIDINKLKKAPVVTVNFKESTRNLEVEDENLQTINTKVSEASISINAACPLDAVTEIRLYQNGKLVETTRNLEIGDDDPVNKTMNKTFRVSLVEGKNRFRAVAYNTQRTESRPVELEVLLKSDKPVANTSSAGIELHLVIVGINQYKNPKYNLNYAQADADAFRTSINEGSAGIFSKVHTHFIKDAEANRAGIVDALDKVKQQSKAEDVFIFYYAGHGVMNDKKEFYLVPSDVTQLYGNDDALAQKGLSSANLQQFSKDIRAQKQLYILDACQSAAALENLMAARGAAEEKAIAQLARSTGTHWLVASGSTQFASEFGQLGHGAFTYCLLEAMKGKADNGDKKITVKELDAYLQNRVPEVTQQYRGAVQYPASYGYGNDFPFLIIK